MDQQNTLFASTRLDDRLPKAVQVYEIMRSAIISMQLPPGAPIHEKEICLQLGISRTPLREAILQLATEDLVLVKPSGGTFVNRILLKEVLDGQITRDTLEMRLVRLAARRFRPDFASEFEVSLFRQARAAERRDFDEFFSLDNEFHRLICNCSGFPNSWRTIHMATGQLDRVRRLAFPIENNFAPVLREHTQIFECLRRNDEAGAASVMQEQLDSIFPTIDLIKRTRPELISDDEAISISDIR